MDKKRIFIVDDHRVVIEGIRSALRGEEGLEVIGEATDAIEAISEIRSLRPDLVILDVSMPRLNGVAAAVEMKALDSKMNIVIFTMYSNKEYVLDLLKAGVNAYVLKEEPIENLISAIHAVKGGGVYGSEKLRDILLNYISELECGGREETGIERLSTREREVLIFLAEGRSI